MCKCASTITQSSRIRFICGATKQKPWRLSHCPQNTYSPALKSFQSPDPTLTGHNTLHLMDAGGNTLHTIHYIFLMWHRKSPRRADVSGICESLNIFYYLVTADGLVLSLIRTGGDYRDRKQTWWVMKVQAKGLWATANVLTVVFLVMEMPRMMQTIHPPTVNYGKDGVWPLWHWP